MLSRALFILVATPFLCAQARLPIVGSAELADGMGWSGAEITFLSRPVPEDERIGEPRGASQRMCA